MAGDAGDPSARLGYGGAVAAVASARPRAVRRAGRAAGVVAGRGSVVATARSGSEVSGRRVSGAAFARYLARACVVGARLVAAGASGRPARAGVGRAARRTAARVAGASARSAVCAVCLAAHAYVGASTASCAGRYAVEVGVDGDAACSVVSRSQTCDAALPCVFVLGAYPVGEAVVGVGAAVCVG